MNSRGVVHLEHFYYGKLVDQGTTVGEFVVTARSAGLERSDAEELRRSASFGSYNLIGSLSNLKHGYGLLRHDENTFLLVHLRPGPVLDRGHVYPEYHYLVVPSDLFPLLAGNLTPLVDALTAEESASTNTPSSSPLETVMVDNLQPLSPVEEADYLRTLGSAFQDDAHKIGQILAALIERQPVAIVDAPTEPEWRFDFCQALALVLPPAIRHRLTFATEVFDSAACPALLKFMYADPYSRSGDGDLQFLWRTGSLRGDAPSHPYADFVASNWRRGPTWLSEAIHTWAASFVKIAEISGTVPEALAALGNKILLHQQLDEGRVTPEALVTAIQSDPTLTEKEFHFYCLGLLNLSVRSDRIDLMRATTKRHWSPSLMGEMRHNLLHLVRQGFGSTVFRLLQDWLANVSDLTIDAAYWSQAIQEVTIAHLAYLSERGIEADISAFVEGSLQSSNMPALKALYPEIIKALVPDGRRFPSIARELVKLAARRQPDAMPGLLSDSQLRQRWSPELAEIAVHIADASPPEPPRPGTLVAACNSVKSVRGLLLVTLAWGAIQRRRIYLLDAAYWRELQSLQREGSWYSDQARRISAAVDDQWWVQSLPDENAQLALVSLRVSQSQDAMAASLLQVMQPQPPQDRIRFANRVRSFVGKDPALSGPAADRLIREMLTMPIEACIMAGACLGALDRSGWNSAAAAVGLANLVVKDRSILQNGEESLRLLGSLARIEGGEMTIHSLDREVQRALGYPQWTYKVNALEKIAEQLPGESQARAQMLNMIRDYAQGLSPDDLYRFHGQLLTASASLSPEAQMTQALLTVRQILGSQDLREFAQGLAQAAGFLKRLEQAFDPSDERKGAPALDWRFFDAALLSEVQGLRIDERRKLGDNCIYLAYTVSNMGDLRTKGSVLSRKSQEKIDNEFYEGRILPKGSIDALKHLAGLFHRGPGQGGYRK